MTLTSALLKINRQHNLAIPYSRARFAAIEGRLPVEMSPGGRWTVAEEDLPELARLLAPASNTRAAA